MVTEYRIYKPIKAIDFLKSMHLSSKNIYKLFSLNALSTTKIIKEQDILENEILYINFSLLETNEELVPVKGKIDIIYEDSNFIALDKKANILIHSDGITNNTLLNYVVYYLQDKYDDSYPRPLHRIDYEAQGVVLFSKNVLAQAYVSYLLETNKVYKRYNVISMGHFPKETNNIKLNIAKDRHNSKKYIVNANGKEAITNIKLIKYIKNNSLLDINIITGRPHQIRVTLSYLGYPIINDSLYNQNKVNGNLMLLSKEFKFTFNNETIDLISKQNIEEL